MRRLLVRPGAIGDCILCFPAMESLATGYTEVWVPSAVVPLVRFADAVVPLASTGIGLVGVGEIPIPRTLAEKLRGFDSIVSWHGANHEEFRRAIEKLGVPCEFHCALPPASDPRHAIDFFAAQVGAPSGLFPRIRIEAMRRDESRRGGKECPRHAVAIHPFSGSARKNWPLANFRELARRLPLPVEWCAGPEEDLPGAVRFDDLGELAAWLAGARLYIGNDSGITHLAAAVGVETLAIFGPTDPARWAPRGENVTVLQNPSLEAVLDASARLAGVPQ